MIKSIGAQHEQCLYVSFKLGTERYIDSVRISSILLNPWVQLELRPRMLFEINRISNNVHGRSLFLFGGHMPCLPTNLAGGRLLRMNRKQISSTLGKQLYNLFGPWGVGIASVGLHGILGLRLLKTGTVPVSATRAGCESISLVSFVRRRGTLRPRRYLFSPDWPHVGNADVLVFRTPDSSFHIGAGNFTPASLASAWNLTTVPCNDA